MIIILFQRCGNMFLLQHMFISTLLELESRLSDLLVAFASFDYEPFVQQQPLILDIVHHLNGK